MIKTAKVYDFTFCSLVIGRSPEAVWTLCAWSKAGKAWIEQHSGQHEQFSDCCLLIAKEAIKGLLTDIAHADLTIAGMDLTHRKQEPLL